MANTKQYVPQTPAFLVAPPNAPLSVKRAAHFHCDGQSNQVEIQAAIDSLPSTGGEVALSGGGYTLSGKLSIPSNCSLRGAGVNVTILTWSDGSYHRIENSDTTNGNSYISIKNMTMDFGGVAGSTDFHGIRLQTTQ